MWLLFAAFGAIWRRVDGGDNAPLMWHLLPLVVAPVVYIQYGFEMLFAYLVAYLAMIDGFKDWTDFGYMSMRFTGYCALACALFGVSTWYILCGLVVGLLYPIGNSLKIPKYTEIAEIVTGFTLFGFLFLY